MMTIICITILIYWILGRDFDHLLNKVSNVDWHSKSRELYWKLEPYALKVGRSMTKPLLQFYYVMSSEQTSTLDKVLIYAAIIYTISPISLIPSAIYRLLGLLDEGAAVLYVYKKIKEKITPEVDYKVEQTLNEWFGVEYELIDE